MRPLELLTVAATAGALVSLAFSSALPGWSSYALALLPSLLALTQWKVEGFRWHMAPVHLLAILLLASLHPDFVEAFRGRLTYTAAGLTCALLLIGSACLLSGVFYPVFEFAKLSGPYSVGSISRHLVDATRLDPYAGSAAKRELMVEIWYPAEGTAGCPRAKYRDARTSGWSDAALNLVRTRSFRNAPLASARPNYPVLLFSGPLNRFQNTFETEDLASHGYIVVAIDHPYDSDLVVFPDGRRARIRKPNTFLDFSSEQRYRRSNEEVEQDLQVRVADVESVVDRLESWNSDPGDVFHERLDLTRIGMFGHSFGGAVTAEVCRRDERLKAGVNMDGWMFGDSARRGVPKPFFFMTDCVPRPSAAELRSPDEAIRLESERTDLGYREIEASLHEYGGYYLQVPELQHMNFTDVPLYSRLKRDTGAGGIDCRRAHKLVLQLTLAFFDKHLRGHREVSLQNVAQAFPEADFKEVPLRETRPQLTEEVPVAAHE